MTTGDTPGDRSPSPPSDDAVVKRFEWTEMSPSLAVVRVISVVLNEQPTELEPLYDSIDADALDRLVRSANADVSVSFTYLDLGLVVHGDGTVVARHSRYSNN